MMNGDEKIIADRMGMAKTMLANCVNNMITQTNCTYAEVAQLLAVEVTQCLSATLREERERWP